MREAGDNEITNIIFVTMLIIMLGLINSCVSTGTAKLSKNIIKNITEGQSNKSQVVRAVGLPEASIKLDKISLCNYIQRVLFIIIPEYTLSEEEYEVWMYNKWSYFAVNSVLLPSYESLKISVVVFKNDDICVKKFYKQKNLLEF
jgi:hypothetical protein